MEWPPRSPDLMPCDFSFFLGGGKGNVYVILPQNIEDLIQCISIEFENLKQNPGLIRRAMRNMLTRKRKSIEKEGSHAKPL